MKLSDYVINFIAENNIKHIFQYIGGTITHLIDSTYIREDIECVSVHHEQAAAFAAEAYARINSKLGVAMATSGPGALNMITGIGSCYFDSVPCMFITGQVNTYEYKFDQPIRQIGFQETDIVSIVKPLTKYAELVIDANKIRYHLEKAVYFAQNGRPGPVLLDIPMNIQRAEIDPDKLDSFFDTEEYERINIINNDIDTLLTEEKIDLIIDLIKNAHRPVVLIGGGIRTADAADELKIFLDKTNLPVVSSLMGLDAVSYDKGSFLGMIGAYGNRHSNFILANCDFLLVLGSRLDTRQTGTRIDSFARAAKKVHVDIDVNELNAKIKVDIAIQSDLRRFLKRINFRLSDQDEIQYSEWYKTIESYKLQFRRIFEKDLTNIDPNHFMEVLSNCSSEGDIICLDVGQHQMWAAQSYVLKDGQRMLITGGMGAMGFALPAGIGAAKARNKQNIIVIAGDGGIQLNIQELDTIVKHNLPIKIFVMNNNCLGMVRQFQDIYFDGRQRGTVEGYNCPNLIKIAQAYGLPTYNIDSLDDVDDNLEKIFNTNGAVFVNVSLELKTEVTPKLIVNRPIEDMSPHLDRAELKKHMIIDALEYEND